jgi:hypothetical protein
MVNPFKEVNWQPSLQEKRKFAWSLVIGFPCLAAVWLMLGRGWTGEWPWTLAAALAGGGAALGLLLLAAPILARPVYVVWYALACSIGLIISNLLLTGFYFTVVTGTRLVLRLFGRESLQKGFNQRAATYWEEAGPAAEAERYYRQF